MSQEKTFTVVGTAINPKGELKVRWGNDLMQRIGILIKTKCKDINLHEMPKPLTKLYATKWLKKNTELTPEQLEVVDLKIYDLEKALKRAQAKSLMTSNVKKHLKENKQTDPRVANFIEKTVTNEES